MDKTLKPCPFCGGEAKIQISSSAGKEYAYIKCMECNASANSVFVNLDYSAKEKAVEAWNNRIEPEKSETAKDAEKNTADTVNINGGRVTEDAMYWVYDSRDLKRPFKLLKEIGEWGGVKGNGQ